MNEASDEQIIDRVRSGDRAAFEVLVKRYQVLVCSIAYSFVGDVATSEDIGQDVFLAAWKKLAELRDPQQFKSWISTITRNQARAWLRRSSNSMQEIERPFQIAAANTEDEAMEHDDADLVWKTLSQLPESYREPLVLYYRADKSVAEVADALSLSQTATKQRLARGREMLRTEVLATIEKSLKKSVPTAAFAVGVMAVVSGTTKTAAAASGVAAAKIAATTAKATGVGALGGSLIGLLGGFGGAFASWYNAEYASQRQLIVRQSITYLIGAVVFCIPFGAMQAGWRPMETLGPRGYGIAYAIWMLTFFGLNGVWMFLTIRSHKQLEKQERSNDTERLPRFAKAQREGWKHEGRRWTSSRRLMGLPLIQVAFPDVEVGMEESQVRSQGTARAWIAIGRFANGRLLAIGHRATAPVALGNVAIGVVSAGVFSCGLISLGVVSIAPVALGVVCIGILSLGGSIAVGYVAAAPMAFAVKAAKGAMVFSLRYADGPLKFAPSGNEAAAREYFASSALMQQVEQWFQAIAQDSQGPRSNNMWLLVIAIVIGVTVLRGRKTTKATP